MSQLILGLDDGMQIAIVGIMGGVAIFCVFAGVLHSMYETRAREKSRREIAAYVAEGSMTPEEGERLLKAGTKKD